MFFLSDSAAGSFLVPCWWCLVSNPWWSIDAPASCVDFPLQPLDSLLILNLLFPQWFQYFSDPATTRLWLVYWTWAFTIPWRVQSWLLYTLGDLNLIIWFTRLDKKKIKLQWESRSVGEGHRLKFTTSCGFANFYFSHYQTCEYDSALSNFLLEEVLFASHNYKLACLSDFKF